MSLRKFRESGEVGGPCVSMSKLFAGTIETPTSTPKTRCTSNY